MESTKLIFAILHLIVCLPAAAKLIDLPAQMPLSANVLILDLGNADVDIQVDPSAIPTIRAVAINDEPVKADLEISLSSQNCRIHRPRPAEGEAPRIRFEITVGARHQVILEGRNLAVTAHDTRLPEDEDKDEDGDDVDQDGDDEDEEDGDDEDDEDEDQPTNPSSTTDSSSLRLVLEDSEANLSGVRDIAIEARRTTVWLHRTLGVLDLNLEYGSAQVRGHQGHLQAEATESEIKVLDLRGDLEPEMTGGSLDVRQGFGLFNGTFTGAVLLLDGWQGHMQMRGSDTLVEARGVSTAVPWNIVGQDLRVTLDEMAARISAQVEGGSFTATSMTHPLTLDATNGTDVDLGTLARGAKLKISNAASARLVDIFGQTQIELYDAELHAERIAQLHLTGERSQVEAEEVSRLLALEMTDSDIVLGLTSANADAAVKLFGGGRTTIRLSTPCSVQMTETTAREGTTANVSGCDLRLQGQPGRPLARPSIQGARRTVTLTVKLDASVDLTVEGLP